MRGFSLLELMTTLAIFGVVATLSIASLGPLKDRYNHERAVEIVSGAAMRAQMLARESGRCHVLQVYDKNNILLANATLPVNDAIAGGTRLRIQRRLVADCDTSQPSPALVEHVEWLDMPEGVQIKLAGPGKPEWRPNGRIQTTQSNVIGQPVPRVRVKGKRPAQVLHVTFTYQGSICVENAPGGNCP